MSEKTFSELIDCAIETARQTDAPLSVRPKAMADDVRRLNPEFADVVDWMVARLVSNGVGHRVILSARAGFTWECMVRFCGKTPMRSGRNR